MRKVLKLAVVASIAAAPAFAQTWSSNAPKIGPVNQPEGILIQPYNASANYCPTGTQPIVLGGVICCGTPNTSEAYSAPAQTRRYYSHSMSCPAGVKGCS